MKISKEDIQTVNYVGRNGYQAISVDKLREVINSIETDTQDCFTGLSADDDWQSGAGFVLRLLRERIGEVLD